MSNILKLDLKDLGKGLLIAILTAAIQYLATLTNLLNVDLNTLISTAVMAGLAYLLKNLATSNDGKFLGKW